jgi:DNA (cytosine-5)-methyltransferase 1
MRCVWQVEIDPYARRVLERHWPDVRRWDDVRTFPPAGDWSCDLVCGGFPCQDISKAGYVQGERRGMGGERSGLWSELARIIRLLRPCFILVENVAKILVRGLGRVLGDLAALGYDAEWHCLPAAAFGAPHIRDRVFILAYSQRDGLRLPGRAPVIREAPRVQAAAREWSRLWTYPHAMGPLDGVAGNGDHDPWLSESAVGRVVDGIPCGLDRNRCLGNAVVPQVAEWIGRRMLAALEG